MRMYIVAACLAVLAGCATCREHPVACEVGGFVLVGVATGFAAAHGHNSAVDPCAPGQPPRSNGVIGSCVGR